MTGQLPRVDAYAMLRERGWRDGALAFALIVSCVLVNRPSDVLAATTGHAGARTALWWSATALATVGVALRRRLPMLMLASCLGCVAAHLAVHTPLMIIDLSGLILLYTVATQHGRAVSASTLAGLLLLATAWILPPAAAGRTAPGLPVVFHTGVVNQTQASPMVAATRQATWSSAWSGLAMVGFALVVSWALGATRHSHRAYLEQLHARARDLERERDQRAALAVAAERGRISRELHDIVAHGLSVIVIQAQGGAAALDNEPADTRVALDAIVRTGRESLADMRRVLNAMGEVTDTWHPQPGLDQLPGLLTRVRRAGTPVRLRLTGSQRPVPSTVDLSAYRIVQEALTNTMKHARTGTAAQVLIRYDEAELGIEITEEPADAAPAPPAGQTPATRTHPTKPRKQTQATSIERHGNGLRGMRERVRLLGGQLMTGPAPDGGFAVRAVLPVGEPDR